MKTIYCLLILHFINLQFMNAMDTQSGGAGGSGQQPPGGSGKRVGRPRKRPSRQLSQLRIMSAGVQPNEQNPQNVQQQPTINPANELFNSSNAPILHCGAFRESPIENTLWCNDCEKPVPITAAEGNESGWVKNPHNHIKNKHTSRHEAYQKKLKEYNSLNASIKNYFYQEANDDENTYRCNVCPPEKNIVKSKKGKISNLGHHLSRSHLKQWTEHRNSVAGTTRTYLGPRAATSRVLQNLQNEVETLRSQLISGESSKGTYGHKRKYAKRENQPSGSRSVSRQIARSQQILPDLNVAIEEPMEEIEHIMMPSAVQRDQQTALQIPVTEQMMQQLHVTQPQHQHEQLIEQSMAQRIASSAAGQQMQPPLTIMSARPSANLTGLLNRMATQPGRSSQIDKGKGIATNATPPPSQRRSSDGNFMGDARGSGTLPAGYDEPIPPQITDQVATQPGQMISFRTGHGTIPLPSSFARGRTTQRPSSNVAPGSGHAPLQSVRGAILLHKQTFGIQGGSGNVPRAPTYDFGITQPAAGTQHSSVRPSSQLAAGRSQFVSVASEYRQGTFEDAGGTGAAQQQSHPSGKERPSGSGAQPNPSQNPTNYDPPPY